MIVMKICSKCNIEKENNDFIISEFNKKSGICKKCKHDYYVENKEAISLQRKGYYLENKEKFKLYHKGYCFDHKEQIKEYNKNYRSKYKEQIKEQRKDYDRNYRLQNKENRNRYNIKRRQIDPQFRLHCLVSSSIRSYLKDKNSFKNKKSICEYIDISKLKLYIESKFEPWMNWSNWGKYNLATWNDDDPSTWTWHIDHIIPQSHFHYTSMDDDDFKKCWVFENLRHYSSKQNLLDGNRR
jgi:hypothetical protein